MPENPNAKNCSDAHQIASSCTASVLHLMLSLRHVCELEQRAATFCAYRCTCVPKNRGERGVDRSRSGKPQASKEPGFNETTDAVDVRSVVRLDRTNRNSKFVANDRIDPSPPTVQQSVARSLGHVLKKKRRRNTDLRILTLCALLQDESHSNKVIQPKSATARGI